MSIREIHDLAFIENLSREVFLEKVIHGFGKSFEFSKLHSGGRLDKNEIDYLRKGFASIGVPNAENLSVHEMRCFAYDIMKRSTAKF